MKKILFILLFLLNLISFAQYPIIEEFNAGTTWVYTNGSGMQNYGGAENYATFNIGNIPYPNNSTVTITSPVFDVSDCAAGLTVSFPISGLIENNFDFMYFQYFNSSTWTTLGTYTGVQNSTPSFSFPNTATQLRFMLISDCSVNGYKNFTSNPCSLSGYPTTCVPAPGNCNGALSVYYYDITRVTISCSSVLPIELLSFTSRITGYYTTLNWTTATETNNDYFTVYKSVDAIDFTKIGDVKGGGTTTLKSSYSFIDTKPYDGVSYYRLKQTDFNGNNKSSNIISVTRNNSDIKLIKVTNLLGQEVSEDSDGIKIYYFNDGSVMKRVRN